jgi:uncharacterized protein YicC (UPF0701 family)
VRVDARLARALAAAFTEISDAVDRPVLPAATDFLRQPGIVSLEESRSIRPPPGRTLSPALAQALDGLVSMRTAEGAT